MSRDPGTRRARHRLGAGGGDHEAATARDGAAPAVDGSRSRTEDGAGAGGGGACAEAQGGAEAGGGGARGRPQRAGDPAPVGRRRRQGACAARVPAGALRLRVPELREGGAHGRARDGHPTQRQDLLHPTVPRRPPGHGDGAAAVGGGPGGDARQPLGHPPAAGRRESPHRLRRRGAGRGAGAGAGVRGGRAAPGPRQGLLRRLPAALRPRPARAAPRAGAGLSRAAAARSPHHAPRPARARRAARRRLAPPGALFRETLQA